MTALGAAASAQTVGVAPDAVVMYLGGKPVTKAEFDRLAAGFQAATRQAIELNPTLIQQLGEIYALEAAAPQRGLAEDPAIASHIRFRTAQLLGAELFRAIQADVLKDDAALREYYRVRQTDYLIPRVRHILVAYQGARGADASVTRTVEQAKARAEQIQQRIAAGAAFAEVAKVDSDDRTTSSTGGLLGTIMRGQTLPQFEEVAFALEKGKVGGPVKTEQGWHLVLVEQREAIAFEKLRATLAYELTRQKVDEIARQGFRINSSVVK
jgi:parvulin-like peptidyl-prolyl isomerase